MPKSKIIMSHQAHTGKVEAVIVPETINIIQCACTRKACIDNY